MNIKKIVITGGPSTGKTSIINKIEALGYFCFEEISREITLEARNEGIPHLFKSDPLLFSERIMEGRIRQFKAGDKIEKPIVFYDRGIPDVVAYMDCFGQTYDQHFEDNCKAHRYDYIFLLPPWKEIHASDNVRYESYEEALRIHSFLEATYREYGYSIIDVPKETVDGRVNFILNKLKNY
ncbi:RecBCD enzyme subunit RecD [Arenibacter antarcticus]|uniref:AAA family ATPase n=1 Tax=Arenibacter antarcticus TaxID=2040469 RepID=A0ABW5VGC2_9FLAO|nr:ATP-binding protein [Arenibacter sp. H213]MCM4166558.1 ATPase [Arenibacter sp. H213]